MADRLLDDTRNFLENFNPNTSERENRKLTRMIYQQSVRNKTRPYDEKGLLNGSGEDLCDCRRPACPGCFFACKRCSSNKCGPVCRANRKFIYKYLTTPTSGTNPVDIDENPVRDRFCPRKVSINRLIPTPSNKEHLPLNRPVLIADKRL